MQRNKNNKSKHIENGLNGLKYRSFKNDDPSVKVIVKDSHISWIDAAVSDNCVSKFEFSVIDSVRGQEWKASFKQYKVINEVVTKYRNYLALKTKAKRRG